MPNFSRRDLLHLRSSTTLHWTTHISASSFALVNITATSASRVVDGLYSETNPRLRGTIESVIVYANTSVGPSKFDVVFCSAATGLGSSIATDSTLDHESFVVGDFLGGNGASSKPMRAVKSGLAINYFDHSQKATFHVGIRNNSSTAIAIKSIVVQFAWRSDMGRL